jgi:beta-N-acetylglucosaminidase
MLSILIMFVSSINIVHIRIDERIHEMSMKQAEYRAIPDTMIPEEPKVTITNTEVQVAVLSQPKPPPQVHEVSRGAVVDRNLKIESASRATVEEINYALRGTKLSGLGECFIKAEMDYGINALFLTALAIEESGWGTSNYAVYRNNLFGLGAYTENPNKAMYFSSKASCIDNAGKILKSDYATSTGRCYRGGDIQDVSRVYSSNSNWVRNILRIMSELDNERAEYYKERM